MTGQRKSIGLAGRILRVMYLALGALFLCLLGWVNSKHHFSEVDDVDHVFVVLVYLTGPIGVVAGGLLSFLAESIANFAGHSAASTPTILSDAGWYLLSLTMLGAGYWQWFWLVPRLWLLLKWGRNWRRHLPHAEENEDEEFDMDSDERGDGGTKKTDSKW